MAATKTQTEIKERPLSFTTDSVKAILEGRKVQTRRLIKNLCNIKDFFFISDDPHAKYYYRNRRALWDSYRTIEELVERRCPYGKPGDRLYVKETYLNHALESYPPVYFYRADGEDKPVDRKWKSPRFMPRAASRITLEITNIRVERLMDITAHDVKREGFPSLMTEESHLAHFEQFEQAWNKINGADSWNQNPFVWVIEFKKL